MPLDRRRGGSQMMMRGIFLRDYIRKLAPTAWIENAITTGTSIPDASGNGHTATLSGNTQVNRAGVLGAKSALGNELLTNGDMSNATGWSSSGSVVFDSGQVTLDSSGGAFTLQQNVLTEGQTCRIVIDVESITGAGQLLFKTGVGTDTQQLVVGRNEFDTFADNVQFLIYNSGVVEAVINSASAKNYSDAHAIYFDDGTEDGLIQMGASAAFATAIFEAVCLCVPTSRGEGNAGTFFSFADGDGSGYPIARWNLGSTITFRVFNSAVTQFEARTTTTFDLHKPHLLFFECRGVDSALRMFRGTAAGAVEVSYAVQQTPTGTMRDSTGQTLNWGNRANTSATWKGLLDECLIFNGQTLSSAERDKLSKMVDAVWSL